MMPWPVKLSMWTQGLLLNNMEQIKIVVFVPANHADAVRQAMGDVGAGKIGNYSHNSISFPVTGRFKPLENANPVIGEVGKYEVVEEARIECVCERSNAKEVLSAIRKVHPYEEVAFDIYPLISEKDLWSKIT